MADARRTYAVGWVSTKLRWPLTVDRAERDALRRLTTGCGHTHVGYQPV
ncbi:hypothetical protein [Streptomyces sp. NPDC018045]